MSKKTLKEILKNISAESLSKKSRKGFGESWKDFHDEAVEKKRDKKVFAALKELIFGESAYQAAKSVNAMVDGDSKEGFVAAYEARVQLKAYLKGLKKVEPKELIKFVKKTIHVNDKSDVNKVVTTSLVNQWCALEVEKGVQAFPKSKWHVEQSDAWSERVELTKTHTGKLLFDTIHASCEAILATAIAKEHRFNPSVSKEEITQEAFHIFQSSIFRYDPTKGAAFSTYLTRRLDRRLRKFVEKHNPTDHASLDAITEDAATMLNFQIDPKAERPEDAVLLTEAIEQLHAIIAEMEPTEKLIMQLHLGVVNDLSDVPDHLLSGNGKPIPVNKEAIRLNYPHDESEIIKVLNRNPEKTRMRINRLHRRLETIIKISGPQEWADKISAPRKNTNGEPSNGRLY